MSSSLPGQVSESTGRQILEAVDNAEFDTLQALLKRPDADANIANDDGESALLLANRLPPGNQTTFKIVKLLIDSGADVNAQSKKGSSALIAACMRDNEQCARLLIEKGADIEARTAVGDSSISLATWKNATKAAKLLISHGAEISRADQFGDIVLIDAIKNRNEELSRAFLDKGINVNHKNNKGKSALMIAVQNDDSDCVKLLLEYKADVTLTDEQGNSAIDLAKQYSRDALVNMMSQHIPVSGDSDAPIARTTSTNAQQMQHAAGMKKPDKNTADAIVAAAEESDLDALRQYIETNNYDPNVANDAGESALLLACRLPDSETSRSIVKLLIENGADVNSSSKKGSTPLISACMRNTLPAAKLLIEKGADINARTLVGDSSISLAVWKDATDTAKLLIDHGVDFSRADTFGDIVLIDAVRNGNVALTRAFLDKNIAVDHQNKKGLNALMCAASGNHAECAKLLLEAKANPTLKDEQGETALDKAKASSNDSIVAMLQVAVDQYEHADNNAVAAAEGVAASDRKQSDEKTATEILEAASSGDLAKLEELVGRQNYDPNVTNDEKESALLLANRLTPSSNATAVTKLLLDNGAVATKRSSMGSSPLIAAAMRNNMDTARLLFEHGADVNHTTVSGDSALSLACWKDAEKTAMFLIVEANANIHRVDKFGDTVLIDSMKNKNNTIVDALLAREINANHRNNKGRSALIEGASCGNYEGCKLLLDYGASVDLEDGDGKTAHQIAVATNHLRIAQLLVEQGDVDPDTGHTAGYSGEEPDEKDGAGGSGGATSKAAAHAASSGGNSSVWKKADADVTQELIDAVSGADMDTLKRLLVDEKYDPNTTNDAGESILLLANRSQPSKPSTMKVIRFLMVNGASWRIGSHKGSTPLIAASMRNNVASCRLMIDAGADVNQYTNDGDSCLSLAVWKDQTEVCRFLMDQPNINFKKVDRFGDNVLLDSAGNSNLELVQLFVEAGITVNHQNNKGETALMRAIKQGAPDIVEYLLENNADPNLADASGTTSVMYAVDATGNGCWRIMQRYQFDTTRCDDSGNSALALAVIRDNLKMLKKLFANTPDEKLRAHKNLHTGATLLMTACETAGFRPDSDGNDDAKSNDDDDDDEACMKQTKEMIQYLLERGESDGAKDFNNLTCIDYAARNKKMKQQLLAFFIEQEKEASSAGSSATRTLTMPQRVFFALVRTGDIELLKWLVNEHYRSINADQVNEDLDDTALMIAAKRDDIPLITYLLKDKLRARMDQGDSIGKTAFFKAIEADSMNTVEYFVQQGSAIRSEKDQRGWNAFAYAAHVRNERIMRFLKDKHFNIDQADTDGITPLLHATLEQAWGLAITLVNEFGCDVHKSDHHDRCPLMVAAWYERYKVVRVILDQYSPRQIRKAKALRVSVQPTEDDEREIDVSRMVVLRALDPASSLTSNDLFSLRPGTDSKHDDDVSSLQSADTWATGSSSTPRRRRRKVQFGRSSRNADTLMAGELDGWGALLSSAESEHWDKVKYFVTHFKNIALADSEESTRCSSALLFALQRSDTDVVNYIVQRGSDVEPITLCLRYAEGFHQLMKSQPSKAEEFEYTASQFTTMAISLFEKVPSDHLAGWILENRFNDEKQTVLEIALDTENIDFLSNPRVNRIADFWWSRTWIEFEATDTALEEADPSSTPASELYGSAATPDSNGHGKFHFGSPFKKNKNNNKSNKKKKHFASPSSGGRLGDDDYGDDDDKHRSDSNYHGLQRLTKDFPADDADETGKVSMAWLLTTYPRRFFRTPQVKFAIEAVSYVGFLVLYTFLLQLQKDVFDTEFDLIEVFVLIWMFAFIIGELDQMKIVHNYWDNAWNILDWVVALLLMFSFACRLVFVDNMGYDAIWSCTDTAIDCSKLTNIYVLCMSANMIMMTIRTCFIFSLYPTVGPLLIMVRRMTGDVWNFIVLELIVVFAFIFSFRFVVQEAASGGDLDATFGTAGRTVLTLIDASLGNAPESIGTYEELPLFRETLAQVMLILFIIASAVIMVNLLIAMMSSTYEEVKGNAFKVYSWSRVEAIYWYDKSNVLPAPFNLLVWLMKVLPLPFVMFNTCVVWIWKRSCRDNATEAYTEMSSHARHASPRHSNNAVYHSGPGGYSSNGDSDQKHGFHEANSIELPSRAAPHSLMNELNAAADRGLSVDIPTGGGGADIVVAGDADDDASFVAQSFSLKAHTADAADEQGYFGRTICRQCGVPLGGDTTSAANVLTKNIPGLKFHTAYLDRCRDMQVCPVCFRSNTELTVGLQDRVTEFITILVMVLLSPIVLVLVWTSNSISSVMRGHTSTRTNDVEKNRNDFLKQLDAVHAYRQQLHSEIEAMVATAVSTEFELVPNLIRSSVVDAVSAGLAKYSATNVNASS
jgi:ankyrin repeat protein